MISLQAACHKKTLQLRRILINYTFLPAKFSDSELTELIAKLIEKLNLISPSEMGAAMKELKSSGDPRIDMGKASQIVKELLATK